MFVTHCPWYVAGPLLGLLIVGLRAVLNAPFGAMGGYVELRTHGVNTSRLGLSAFLLIGFAAGGAMFALASGPFGPATEYAREGAWLPVTGLTQVAVLVAAGVAMGYGARRAKGCTSGHGLSGMSLGSPASVAATITFFITAVVVAHLATWLAGGWA